MDIESILILITYPYHTKDYRIYWRIPKESTKCSDNKDLQVIKSGLLKVSFC